jgi:hypothetical protein
MGNYFKGHFLVYQKWTYDLQLYIYIFVAPIRRPKCFIPNVSLVKIALYFDAELSLTQEVYQNFPLKVNGIAC